MSTQDWAYVDDWSSRYAAAVTRAGLGTYGDRGNKLIIERGWPGDHRGPAGPCISYSGYAAAERKAGREPLPPTQWLDSREIP
jgi:hypothetical protein